LAHRPADARRALYGDRRRRPVARDRGTPAVQRPRHPRRRVRPRFRRRRPKAPGGGLSCRHDRGSQPLRSRRPSARVVGPDRAGASLTGAAMAIREADLTRLREQVSATIRRGTNLLADLKSLDGWVQELMPALSRLSESEREAFVARLCGYDAS